jgi:hypothetical protein
VPFTPEPFSRIHDDRTTPAVAALWLDVDLGVTVDLEASYEEACHVLHIA